MGKFTREDKTTYFGADKERPEYVTPPANNTEQRNIPVGVLNHNFAVKNGPQRNRPEDNVSKKTGNTVYRRSLFARSRSYGEFSWALLSPRVVSERRGGVLYPLDGNGSNFWIERLFGPEFEVPCVVIKGLSLREEKDIFLKLQDRKRVTPTEKFKVDTEYDEQSLSYAMKGIVEDAGFYIGQRTTDPNALGRTTAEWVIKKYGSNGRTHGLNALRTTLEAVTVLFPEDDFRRTNGALVKAIAVVIHNDDEFPTVGTEKVLEYIRQSGAQAVVGQSRGSSAEAEVLQRLHDVLGY